MEEEARKESRHEKNETISLQARKNSLFGRPKAIGGINSLHFQPAACSTQRNSNDEHMWMIGANPYPSPERLLMGLVTQTTVPHPYTLSSPHTHTHTHTHMIPNRRLRQRSSYRPCQTTKTDDQSAVGFSRPWDIMATVSQSMNTVSSEKDYGMESLASINPSIHLPSPSPRAKSPSLSTHPTVQTLPTRIKPPI